jgi:hypothetical protein
MSGSGRPGTDRLVVRGGVGGTSVALDDLTAAASALLLEAGDAAAQAGRLGAAFPGPLVVAEAVAGVVRGSLTDGLRPPDPRDVASVLVALAHAEAVAAEAMGPSGESGQAALLAGLAVAVRGAAAAYLAGEAAAEALVGVAEDSVMGLAGAALPTLAPGLAVGAFVAVVDPAVRDDLERVLFDHPWLTDVVAGGADGLVDGLAAHDPRLLWLFAWACAREGVAFPPRDDAGAVAVLRAVGSLGGLLDEPVPDPVVRRVATAPDAVVPTSLTGVVAGQQSLDQHGPQGRVRVIEVPQPDGTSAWVVEIPGTQEWRPRAGPDPFDVTTDVAAMAGDATVAARGVTAALDDAMAAAGRTASGDPVLLTGHSQGGILAAALASDPAFRAGHRVTQVVTAGSPVARFPVPDDVSVLSLENAQDPVPHLDGSANPDRATWTTVTRDLAGDRDVDGSPFAGHDYAEYAETARALDSVPPGENASVDHWRAGATAFLSGDAHGRVVVRDYRVERLPER